MKRVAISISANQRLIVYPEGGCQLEECIDGEWFVDNRPCDALAVLSAAADAIERCAEHLKLLA